MHSKFSEFAKAFIRYRQTVQPTKDIHKHLKALQAMEYALRQDMTVPDITKFTQRHWDIAIAAVEGLASRSFVCTSMKDILQKMSDLFILTSDPRFWQHPYVGPRGWDVLNGSKAPPEVRAKKEPNQDSLLAIAEVFSRGANEHQEHVDIMVTCMTGILISAPMRIGETLRLRIDCFKDDKDKNGNRQHYLSYWAPKTQEFTKKPIPKTISSVTKESIERILKITEPGRKLAKYMETNPKKFYRHPNCPNVPEDQVLTAEQVTQALGFSAPGSTQSFMKRHTGKSALTGHTLSDLWKMVLEEHRKLNPFFPFQECPDSSSQPPIKMSESLLCFCRNQLVRRGATSPVLLKTFDKGHYSRWLRDSDSSLKNMNFFLYHGYELGALNSHSIRHLLNRLARAGGVSMELLTEWSTRATIHQTRTYLHDDVEKLASTAAKLLGTVQTPMPLPPISEEEAEKFRHGPFHRSRYGICTLSWQSGPCNKFADCLNCSDLVMCKGDRISAAVIERERDDLLETYLAAKHAVLMGDRPATRWMEKTGPFIERLNQLLTILNNPDIPEGSPIQISGEDFSHEGVITSEKAKKAGVLLIDRAKLGLDYGEELIYCLDMPRGSTDD